MELFAVVAAISIIAILPCSISALTQDAPCTNVGGICEYLSNTCAGNYTSGLCPNNPNDVMCCVLETYPEGQCTELGGTCQDDWKSCPGGYESGKCPTQKSRVRCCKPSDVYQEAECTNEGGTCKMDSQVCSGGSFQSGLCPTQPGAVKCCVPSPSVYQETACTNAGGTCKLDSQGCSGGSFRSGLCPTQPSDVKCCVPGGGSGGSNGCGCYSQGAIKCSTGPAQGATKLANYLKSRFGGYTEIYNCRNVRGGSTKSLHAEGRAVDIYLETAEGDDCFDHVIHIACDHGIQEVIWDHQIWTKANGRRVYRGAHKHEDHVHIGLNRCGAVNFNLT